ncbi:podocan [Erpetoichthys calabaricus]|uniref:podocan n=1 Tax=Erpetoichthys calabaricus TaxID=27687 RepID=UPI0022347460|nr:podocan [Erpetoichthys calabaricus]
MAHCQGFLWALCLAVLTCGSVDCQIEDDEPELTFKEKVPPATKNVCVPECKCVNDGEVDCEGVNLAEFPEDLPESTRHLLLQNNRIHEIPHEMLARLQKLETLNLQNNLLTSHGLEDEAFEVLENLNYLYLSNNKLTAPPRFLPPSLISVDFAVNQLTKVYLHTFGQKAGLKSVYLHNNKLTDAGLPDHVFNGSDNIETLIMSSNFLKYVPKNLPVSLNKLHLKSNRLEKIPKGAFTHLSELRELYLQNNLLTNDGMDNETFIHLNSLEYLDLSSNNLSLIPQGLPRNLVLLHLEKNAIHSIADDVLTPIRDLEYLLLHNNKLRSVAIDPKAFQGLKKLHTLHMYNNQLERIPRGLPRRAKTLMLLHNKISEIGRNDLVTLYSLTDLNLSYNKLTSPKVHKEAFRKLRLLEVLDLSGNSLQMLPVGLPKSLQELKMKDNELITVSDGAFEGMDKLREVYLSNNKLKVNSMYQGAWQELSSLNILDLSLNQLSHVPADLPESLEYLYLQGNRISTIPVGIFDGTPNLKVINLRYNRLAPGTIKESVFSHLKNLQALDFGSSLEKPGIDSNSKLGAWFEEDKEEHEEGEEEEDDETEQ